MGQVFVRASKRAKAYVRTSGATFRAKLKAAGAPGYPKRALATHNGITHHLMYGKKRSPARVMQLKNVQDRLKDAYRR